jgi:CubicO group peptidase (beta-lactamase class C family)
VPADKLARLAVCDAFDPATGRRTVTDHPRSSHWAAPPAVPSGAGGMVSTAADYERFGRMLLGMGKLDGCRILSRKAVELMTADRMPPEVRAQLFFGFDFWSEKGFGLGVWVRDRTGLQRGFGSPGSYGWGGAFGTWWFNDPAEDLVAVLMIQTFFPDPTPLIHRDFRTAVYQAIDD